MPLWVDPLAALSLGCSPPSMIRSQTCLKVFRGWLSEHEVARPPNEVYYLIKHSEEGVEPAGNVVKLNVDSG